MEQERFLLDLQNKQDRELVALALYRAGYTVREVRTKDQKSNKIKYALEYWK